MIPRSRHRRRKSRETFRFQPFSRKQRQLMRWWQEDSPHADKDIVIADGAIRSGKTIAMICGFLWWSLATFQGESFIIAGKSMGALKRNVIRPMLMILRAWGLEYDYNRSDNVIYIGTNEYYLFGAVNESSQDVLQGMTAAGAYADEVALFPKSFVYQMMARCSVTGRRIWMNCNPEGPGHWFLKEFIQEAESKRIYHLRFTLDDNLTLDQAVKEGYHRQWSGVFYLRNILGEWAAAEGAIYMDLVERPERYLIDEHELPQGLQFGTIGVDFGGRLSGHSFTFTAFTRRFETIVTMKDFYRKGVITPQQLESDFLDFVRSCEQYNIPIAEILADSAEQVLIAGLNKALIEAKMPYQVTNAKKGLIIDRIRLYVSLLAQERWKIMRHCKHTFDAFTTAVFDDKSLEDKRLDDGSTIMDPIDSQEYSTEPYMDVLMYGGGKPDGQRLSNQTRIPPSRTVG